MSTTNNPDICGIINPTLTLSGPCAECGGSGRIPVEGFQCDECGAVYGAKPWMSDEVPIQIINPNKVMPCGHPRSFYYDTRFCKPCQGIGKRQEVVTLPDLFDLLENERERRKQEEDDRREQALSDRMGREYEQQEQQQREWERRIFGGGA